MKKVVLILSILAFALNAQVLKVAAGAGYKKPLMELITKYQANGKHIEPFFGNMRQVSAQAKQSDIAIIVGDKNFLSKKSGLKFKRYLTIGKGKVVIAYPKNSTLSSSAQLMQKGVKKISIPQPKKAIYGIAGLEFLKNAKIYDGVKNKLYIVSTVPQAMTYVITGEVDAGIVNLTAALANKDKIGGFLEVKEDFYTPIDIVAGVLPTCNDKKCRDFLDFLQTKESQEVFKKYGL